jgi:hypothetical protein
MAMELSTSGILSRMFEMMKGRFGPLLGIWFVYFAVQIAFSIVFLMVIGASVFAGGAIGDPAAMAGLGVGMIVLMLVFYLVYLLIYVASYASLTSMASPLHRPAFGDALYAGVRSALPLFGAMLLLLVAYFVVALVIGMITGLLGTAGSTLFAIVLIPALIYIGCRLSIIFPLVAVDGIRNPITAITRSWNMTGGSVLGILGATLVYLLIAVVLFAVVFLPVFGSAATLVDPAAAMGTMLFFFVGVVIVGIVVSIMGAALAAAIHGGLSDTSGGRLSETFE